MSTSREPPFPARVLVVEDEPAIADALRIALEAIGFAVLTAARGEEAIELDLETIDLALLDVMLPGMTGFELCRRIRERSVMPIIMLTARGAEADRVRGLEVGADDYVIKPFAMEEVIARVRAHLRRRRAYDAAGQTVVDVGGLKLDLIDRTVQLEDRVAQLTDVETRLLRFLASRAGRVCSRAELTGHLWQSGFINDSRTCDTHIKNLRRKLERDPAHPQRLLAVRGVGYLLRDPSGS